MPDSSLIVSTTDSISVFSSGAASDFPVVEEADFLELPALLSRAMASVAVVPLPAKPLVDRSAGAAWVEAFLPQTRQWFWLALFLGHSPMSFDSFRHHNS